MFCMLFLELSQNNEIFSIIRRYLLDRQYLYRFCLMLPLFPFGAFLSEF